MPNLVEQLRTAGLFHGIDADALAALLPELQSVSLLDGEVLVRPGDPMDAAYLVVSGRLRVSAGRVTEVQPEPRFLYHADPGESVCEVALLAAENASVTVLAEGETNAAGLSREAFDRFQIAYPRAALQLTESLARYLRRHRLAIALQLGQLADTPDSSVLHDLTTELELFTLFGGEVLFRQGEHGDYLYILISGRLRVLVRGDKGEDAAVTELAAGEVLGEMALLTGQPRSATVEAVRDSQLAKLSKAAFDRLVLKHPEWAVRTVSRRLAERLRETTAGGSRRPRTVRTLAIVPVHPESPVSEVCTELAREFANLGSTVHIDSQRVDAHLGRSGIAETYERGGGNLRLTEWLGQLELEHDFVLYEAGPRPSPWTERCLRQADHVLLVAGNQENPSLGEIEAEVLRAQDTRLIARRWLVLAHQKTEVCGTAQWLENRSGDNPRVERHVHVHLGETRSFRRLARLLTGRAVGLTLGGGFARGLAHLGVFRAFDELGIEIDAVGGASMGALVGALWCMGWDEARILREVSAACDDAFGDLTFPFVAFKRGRKFSEAVRKIFGATQVDDLPIPYFCISANLNRSELRVHTNGSLAKAILAATRAPGVFPPVIYDGELHVDGGVINNVPVDLMKNFSNQGVVVGVDVSPPHELHPVRDYGDEVSGWQAFWKRANPWSNHRVFTPSILLVMIRTLEFTGISNKNARLKAADVYMHPQLLGFKRTDFHRAEGIVQVGYECARVNMSEWLERSKASSGAVSHASGRFE